MRFVLSVLASLMNGVRLYSEVSHLKATVTARIHLCPNARSMPRICKISLYSSRASLRF